MNRSLERRLDRLGAKPIEQSKLDEYKERMEKEVIPNILRDVRERQRLAAEARYAKPAGPADLD